MDQTDKMTYWLALKGINGLGIGGVKNLLDALKTPAAVFKASYAVLSAVPGIGKNLAGQIRNFKDWAGVERELETARREQIHIVPFQDPTFPIPLKNIYDCPLLLYAKGHWPLIGVHLAVVGSRRASAYGRFTTERLSRDLTLQGITIVSGMARGIDAAAHRGALSVQGPTVAVLGSGIDVVYPPENRGLYEAIPERGTILTEYPFGTPPLAPHFPARNRIISGLSLGVVVVEASEKSGSLITARLALEQGREVFAVPGGIDAAGSRGTHKLIKEGATLVEGIDDILPVLLPQIPGSDPLASQEELGAEGRKTQPLPLFEDVTVDCHQGGQPLDAMESTVLALLGPSPRHIDDVIQSSGLKAADIARTLLTLELQGLVCQTPGKMYLRKEGPSCLKP